MTRITAEHMFMAIAKTAALRSTCTRRAAVGAVLATTGDHRIVATGYNGAPAGFPHCDDVGCTLDTDGHCVKSVHAEINALLQCAKNGVKTAGCTIYCTHSPCPRCAVALVAAGIEGVVFSKKYRDFELTFDILRTAGVWYRNET